MIITIDGPAGSGKSTAARKLAARLEVAYLDTGAMYRAIAFTAMTRGLDPADESAMRNLTQTLALDVDCGPTHVRVRVDGHDVSEAIRSIEVSKATSSVAKIQSVRDNLVAMQRRIGTGLGSFVTEGRDQGSVVFPKADFQFVLTASPKTRALRRYQELVADGQDVTLEQVSANIDERDAVDAPQWEPLLASGRATILDTTGMTLSEVVDRLEAVVRDNRS